MFEGLEEGESIEEKIGEWKFGEMEKIVSNWDKMRYKININL